MAVKLFLSPEADQDIAEVYWWYENQRLGLEKSSSGLSKPHWILFDVSQNFVRR